MHREYYAKSTEAKKLEQDFKDGYIVRVDEELAVKQDALDPELLTGRPLTEEEAYWVQKKQARRAGPPSSSWPSEVPTPNQHTEYVCFTEKAFNSVDPDAPGCSECGSEQWGTSIIAPLSRPADTRPSADVISEDAPLCLGCSRLFECVKDRKKKIDMINWITHKASNAAASKPSDKALMRSCVRRAYWTKNRAHKHFSKVPSNFVTAQELFERVKYNDYNCYVVGSPMCLQPNRFNSSISFDHLFPISTTMTRDDCWPIDNLQPMAHCLNHVKANEEDSEEDKEEDKELSDGYSSSFCITALVKIPIYKIERRFTQNQISFGL